MKSFTKKRITQSVLESITCDKCGKTVAGDDSIGLDTFVRIEHHGGYASTYPGDMQHAGCDLCEDCLKELLGPYMRVW